MSLHIYLNLSHERPMGRWGHIHLTLPEIGTLIFLSTVSAVSSPRLPVLTLPQGQPFLGFLQL